MAFFGYLPKLNRGLELAFGAHFYLFRNAKPEGHRPFSILPVFFYF